ncbi:hypothetical protein H5410_001722 [Solanum commersonii]|uniref:Uncharacterized protein n=1 Tax=Solanum commersonii TaxID=4109 RepID=A0A9J6AZK8_SOLCO|nr:hypothetical protein H5410_001722 [Solanum commersonii]
MSWLKGGLPSSSAIPTNILKLIFFSQVWRGFCGDLKKGVFSSPSWKWVFSIHFPLLNLRHPCVFGLPKREVSKPKPLDRWPKEWVDMRFRLRGLALVPYPNTQLERVSGVRCRLVFMLQMGVREEHI